MTGVADSARDRLLPRIPIDLVTPHTAGDPMNAGNPVFSVDTKKKELLGTLDRAGRVYCQQPFHAYDHDFPSWATGKLARA